MTILQVVNSFFYILIYPFVINTVGLENYGLYVFATSIAAYFMVFINFGFDMHAAKLISLDQDDKELQASLLSLVTAAKLCLELFAVAIFAFLIMNVPFMRANYLLFVLCFANTVSCIFLPQWYFHGMQKMKILTIIQLSLKLISLPAIFFLVDSVGDVDVYAFIVIITNVLASLIAFGMAIKFSREPLKWPVMAKVKALLFEVQPFFWSSATNTLKQKSVEIIIGSLFGMKEVAIYDLANKIFSVPSLLASNINAALFPMMVKKAQKNVVNKIIKIEVFIGLLCMLSVVVGGYWVVRLISVHDMQEAYYLSMLLSFNIMTFLVVGSHIYFIFIPHRRYDFVLRNQVFSVISFYVFCAAYLSLSWSVYSVVLALVSSALLEIFYSYSLVNKVKGY
ncbi:oligosaccharide flippase family protein [Pseudomonas spirodelae]|uniref:Oligosaccharide flippase family protein n=1 Tax=Pseudomonas spirodelae TaxID=3101751 RepID=A0ABU5P765_9PSED|nr:oligosaccharide flippase family protein [Pseudomonas sp. T5W1]MEA1605400.1 oligosaccharide flippase family protein [Pseudomonas sp. T5W1]